jgi:ABC-type transporter lipoprotein component MlaA
MVNPLSLLPVVSVEEIVLERVAAQGFDQRSESARFLEVWQRDSLDFYSTLRSAYRQHRADRISQAKAGSVVARGVPAVADGERATDEPDR